MIPKEGFVMLKLLNIDEFSFRIVIDMQKYFPVVKKEKDFIYVEHFPTNMSIPIRSMYSEYCVTRNYNYTLNTYLTYSARLKSADSFLYCYRLHCIFGSYRIPMGDAITPTTWFSPRYFLRIFIAPTASL